MAMIKLNVEKISERKLERVTFHVIMSFMSCNYDREIMPNDIRTKNMLLN